MRLDQQRRRGRRCGYAVANGFGAQAGGLVAADGNLIVDGGLFHFSGGALRGAFTSAHRQIRVDAGVTQLSTIDVVGHNTLLDNAGAAILRVQGGSPLGDGDAVLTAADAATNAGTIILESLDGVHHGYFRVPAGTFTNKASGVIQVNLPPGDAGPGSIIAGWLDLGDAGRLSSANFPVLPAFTSLLAQLQYYIALGIPVDPQLLQQALLMTQTAQVPSALAVTTTGRYIWSLQLTAGAINQTVSGSTFVVANDNSPFGAGWTFGPTDRLVSIAADALPV